MRQQLEQCVRGVMFLTLVVMLTMTTSMVVMTTMMTTIVLALLVLVRPGESAAAGDSHRAVAGGVASRRGEQHLQSP